MKKNKKQFIFALLLFLIPFADSKASNVRSNMIGQPGIEQIRWPESRKTSFIQRIRQVKEIKKQLNARYGGEKASKLARASMLVYFGSYALGLIVYFIPALVWLVLLGIAAGIILATIVLLKEKNRKSRILAKVVLISAGGMVIAAALTVLILLLIFSILI